MNTEQNCESIMPSATLKMGVGLRAFGSNGCAARYFGGLAAFAANRVRRETAKRHAGRLRPCDLEP
jgi:hypothetical protein